MYNAASAAEAFSFSIPNVAFAVTALAFHFQSYLFGRDRKSGTGKTSFFMFFGFRIDKKSLKSNFFEKVVFFDASKRSKRLKGEKSFQLGSAWRLAAPAALLIFEKGLKYK